MVPNRNQTCLPSGSTVVPQASERAGHLQPFLMSHEHTGFIDVNLGLPIGVSGDSYRSTKVAIGPPATLVAFTDGLVERRYENLDTGLKRLEEALTSSSDSPLDELLSQVVDELGGHTSEDDIAILGLRGRL